MTPTTNDQFSPGASPSGSGSGAGSSGGGLTEAARDEAGHLKDTTLGASQQVAGTAKEQAGEVAADVREQTRRLAGQTRDQLAEQAGQQRDRAVEGLRSVGDELRGMAEHGQSGWGSQLVRQGADWTDQAADFIQNRGAGEVLDDIRGVARRRPGAFLLAAAAAGVVAGRLSRAMAAGAPGRSGSTGEFSGSQHSGTPLTTGPTTTGPVSTGPADTGYQGGYGNGYGDVGTPPAGTATGQPVAGTTDMPGTGQPADDLRMPPPRPTPSAPDFDPGAPVQPGFGPGTGR